MRYTGAKIKKSFQKLGGQCNAPPSLRMPQPASLEQCNAPPSPPANYGPGYRCFFPKVPTVPVLKKYAVLPTYAVKVFTIRVLKVFMSASLSPTGMSPSPQKVYSSLPYSGKKVLPSPHIVQFKWAESSLFPRQGNQVFDIIIKKRD